MKDYEREESRKGGAGFFVFLAIVAAAIIGFRFYWENTYGGVVVDGASMNQTLETGDKLLMRYLKDAEELEHGDVIVVRVVDYEEFDGTNTEYLIKRLIAKEGDKVRCTDGQVEICYAGTTEYVILDEPYAYYKDDNKQLYDFAEYVVGEDEIFFLGDNRLNSCDSRYQEANGSHLTHLYKEDDVYGVVSDWAIENRSWLSKIFFWKS
jgi:signal peptidase I